MLFVPVVYKSLGNLIKSVYICIFIGINKGNEISHKGTIVRKPVMCQKFMFKLDGLLMDLHI